MVKGLLKYIGLSLLPISMVACGVPSGDSGIQTTASSLVNEVTINGSAYELTSSPLLQQGGSGKTKAFNSTVNMNILDEDGGKSKNDANNNDSALTDADGALVVMVKGSVPAGTTSVAVTINGIQTQIGVNGDLSFSYPMNGTESDLLGTSVKFQAAGITDTLNFE